MTLRVETLFVQFRGIMSGSQKETLLSLGLNKFLVSQNECDFKWVSLCFAWDLFLLTPLIVKQIALILFFTFFSLSQSYAVYRGEKAYADVYKSVVTFKDCSAVIVHPRVLLTAAHCVPYIPAGMNELYFENRNINPYTVTVFGPHPQPNYVHQVVDQRKSIISINHDIAVVILKDPIQKRYLPEILPRLATSEDAPTTEENLTAVGFGLYRRVMNPDGDRSINDYRRKTTYRLQGKKLSVLFMKSTTRGIGICHGDSGGALFSVKNNTLILQGILTTTGGDCGGDHMDYAESISSQRGWIQAVLLKYNIAL